MNALGFSSRLFVLAFISGMAFASASACKQTAYLEEAPANDAGLGQDPLPPLPQDIDSGRDGGGFISYCASNKCPAGYTTCPDSRFPCEVNLLTDQNNCGACGAACPILTQSESYECRDGRCVMQCSTLTPRTLDCDGLIDNGCETKVSAQDSCGACGVTCTDPDKPCINRSPPGEDYECGCKDGKTYCPLQYNCVDTKVDDDNCGKCANRCDPTGLDPSLHMYYGCLQSKCGSPKCVADWADCDGDRENGCETDLRLPENCGSCGNACSLEQSCKHDTSTPDVAWRCLCPPNLTLCPLLNDYATCNDLSSDRYNCGGCGIWCNGGGDSCVNGTCQIACSDGFADCNGSAGDYCEVNIASDPNNCGGCGITCNGIVGQACVQGRCVVEPCDEAVDAGRGPQ